MCTPYESHGNVMVKKKATFKDYIKEAIKSTKYHLSLAVPFKLLKRIARF